MHQVEVAFYMLPPPPGRRTPYRSRFKMTADEAAQRGALEVVPGSAELRQVPETAEERTRALTHYQSAGHDSVQPPKE